MAAPLFLLILSLAGVAVALVLPGFSDLLLLAAPAALASLFLLLRALRGPRDRKPRAPRPRKTRAPREQKIRAPRQRKMRVVIDGSNVMHWKDGTPELNTVREVLINLRAQGFHPGVVFDANAGYKLAGQYQHDRAFSQLLGLPRDEVMVVPRGTPADPWILTAARDLGARIVTNDRFRDWAETYPEVTEPGYLIRGGFRNGEVWLDLP
ncbi:MAG: hypothetical protein CSA74_02930 [Rhodobacterales bacterium]|nr:MAG: hypothetical protein CSA74_02930 [Rhodobacterales bacterium]